MIKRAIKYLIRKTLPYREVKSIDVKRSYNIVLDKTRLQGLNIIVTGGSGVIGRAICLRLALEGANVYVGGSRSETTNAVVKELESLGLNAVPLVFDLKNYDSIQAAINSVKNLNAIICCAGGGARDKMQPLIKQEPSLIESIIDVNLKATIFCSKLAAKKISMSGGGSIITISSTVGTNGLPKYSEYSAAKGGIISFTKAIAMELGEYNIRVNCITPGIVERSSISEDRMAQLEKTNWLRSYDKPEDIASMAAYLLSDEASFITGQNFIVDGGRSLD
ncbi:MAG: SDR family oxidoreductase [Bacteroidales bacterium]|nr:SDR family oxidoreductase [Bacteroidales bacterium]